MEVNTFAKTLKSLHQPSQPLILTNVWSIPSLKAVVSLNTSTSQPVKALATASYAVAETFGLADEELTYEQNLEAIRTLAPHAKKAGLPLSVDLQDGYGDRIAEAVKAAVEAGAAGANIEDSIPSAGTAAGMKTCLYPLDEQIKRLRNAVQAASDAGCPDFVINARSDIFHLEDHADIGSDEDRMTEGIKRGKAFLEAGATTIFFWGRRDRPLKKSELERLVKELGGRVSVLLHGVEGGPTTKELGEIGVARVSIGPSLFLAGNEAVRKAALGILENGKI